MNDTKLKLIDMFAGAGGLSTGFCQTNRFNVLAAVENKKDMQDTYKLNHESVDMYADILDINYSELINKYGSIDVVVGGPPCQGFSNANRQRNHIVNMNNQLTKTYINAIKTLNPKAFVLENVRTLASDSHMFFCTNSDYKEILELNIDIHEKKISIPLPLGFEKIVSSIIEGRNSLSRYLLSEKQYKEINAIYKHRNSEEKFQFVFNKKARVAEQILTDFSATSGEVHSPLSEILMKYSVELSDSIKSSEIDRSALANFVESQRLLSKINELYSKDVSIRDFYVAEENLVIVLSGYGVLDYIKKKLSNEYYIVDGVLNAANYGAPQTRRRFIIMGVRKEVSDGIMLPPPIKQLNEFNTVRMVLEDLEEIEPTTTMDSAVQTLSKSDFMKINSSPLNKYLRDSDEIFNHINTKSRPDSVKKFQQLRQGQNFHDLDETYKSNYSDPSRTQNSIYKRLEYDEPSGTVVNVRKSMWIHPVKDRAISIREAARLQTFPDSYVFMGTKDSQYQQVGNAVPPVLARSIAEAILLALGDEPDQYLRDEFNE